VTIPLNINLLIPFKDNEGARRNLYRKDIERFRERLEARAAELRDDLISNFGEDFELTIAGRSDGTTTKFFWRFRSSKRDRKYVRLHAETVVDYLKVFDPNQVLHLKDIEEELIYLNANLRLLKGFIDAIEQSESELVDLRAAEF